jgi:hypothetical protein
VRKPKSKFFLSKLSAWTWHEMEHPQTLCVLLFYERRETQKFESLFVSLFIVVLQEQRVYASRAILFYSGTRSSPPSYRQPRGRGQLLSRRYCKHSVCLFSCAIPTASESQGALAVSCKNFKQSNWPGLAAQRYAQRSKCSNLRSTRYSSTWR